MSQFAFIFPGQGSQKVGMGSDLVENFQIAREVFDNADSSLGRSISQLCFEGPEEELRQTENTQLAILTCSVAILRILTLSGIIPRFVAGHSLGEYSALVASDVIELSDALRLVSARAQFMAESGEEQDGTMAAILGMETEILQQYCDSVDGIVKIANYNCPGQLVISGEVVAVKQVIDLAAKDIGSRRCRLLPVSGAFHSPLMESAQVKFQDVLDTVTLNSPKIDIVMNVTGELATEPEDIRSLLFQQITAPVQWEKTLNTMASSGIDNYLEVGPGKVLSGLVKRTYPDSTCMNVEDLNTISLVLDEYGNGR
ncbi:[acyl-carrier-protein] S-malonyltransferase [Candidatus Poribacteria bacterium]|nr:MAG: [acyl-carrier-protein] S-malonyltransferase [Candidatus Poribacteria bacterium]